MKISRAIVLPVVLAIIGAGAAGAGAPQALWVVNNPGAAPFSLTRFAAGAAGNAPPGLLISDSALDQPFAIAADAAGDVYVANLSSDSILEYSPSGPPVATIAGPATALDGPCGLALDAARNLYVTNSSGPTVTVYPAASNGDASPLATIAGPSTSLGIPFGIALDANANLYVTDLLDESVKEFAAGASGNTPPIRTIMGAATGLAEPAGVALDAAGLICVSNNTANSVTEYASDAAGDAAPLATIAGPSTGLDLPTGLAFDGAGNLYVANAGNDTVTAYSPGSQGDVAPILTIAGAKTKLAGPRGITFALTTATLASPTPTGTPSATVSATPSATPTPQGSPDPKLSVSIQAIAFAPIGIDTGPVAHRLRIENMGRGTLVGKVDASQIAPPFSISPPGGTFRLTRHHATVYTVRFNPTAPGFFSGAVVITSNDSLHPMKTVTVIGESLSGRIVAPAARAFGRVRVGRSKLLTMGIRNAGPGILHVTINPGDLTPFAIVRGAGTFKLRHGHSRVLAIRFAPRSAGGYGTAFTISSDDSARPMVSVTLTGTGY